MWKNNELEILGRTVYQIYSQLVAQMDLPSVGLANWFATVIWTTTAKKAIGDSTQTYLFREITWEIE